MGWENMTDFQKLLFQKLLKEEAADYEQPPPAPELPWGHGPDEQWTPEKEDVLRQKGFIK